MAKLLRCQDARIDVGGSVALEGLSFVIDAERAALIGQVSPLLRLFSGGAEITAGQVSVCGQAPSAALRSGEAGFAPLDLELPPKFTVLDYLVESARLLGVSQRQAEALARAAIDGLGLGQIAARPLERSSLPERRALSIAHARLGEPKVLVVESPLLGLEPPAQTFVTEVLDRAAFGRRLLISAPALDGDLAEVDLLRRMDDLVVLEHGQPVAQGSPGDILSGSRRYQLRVFTGGGRLKDRLTERGCEVTLRTGAPLPGGDAGADERDALLVVTLAPGLGTRDLVAAADAADASLYELVPLRPEAPG